MRFWGFHNLFRLLICLDCIIMCHFLYLESIITGNRPFILALCFLVECTSNYLSELNRQLGNTQYTGPHFWVNYFGPDNYQLSSWKKLQWLLVKQIVAFPHSQRSIPVLFFKREFFRWNWNSRVNFSEHIQFCKHTKHKTYLLALVLKWIDHKPLRVRADL